jgi:hypothetical protein
MNNVTFTEIDTNIYVYKGLLPQHKEMVDTFKSSEKDPESSVLFKDWKQWSRFGTYVWEIGKGAEEKDKNLNNDVYAKEQSFMDEITNAFNYATQTYLETHGMSVGDDWVIMGPSISKYDWKNSERNGGGDGLDMVYHTDYVTLEGDWPGNKFILTCTMYLNDDYEGGDITFLIPGKGILDYKPVAGDVLVFPSGHPDLLSDNGKYLHGVKQVEKEDKYLIRCFYQKPFEGNPEWLEKRNQYGEELWMKMESERVEKQMGEYLRMNQEYLKNNIERLTIKNDN